MVACDPVALLLSVTKTPALPLRLKFVTVFVCADGNVIVWATVLLLEIVSNVFPEPENDVVDVLVAPLIPTVP